MSSRQAAAGTSPRARPARWALRRAGSLAAAHPGLLLALALAGGWALAYPHTPDLAAQDYRAYLFGRFGWQVWDNNWYGGHPLLGYSLLFGPVAWLLGLRLAAVAAIGGSVVLFDRLAAPVFGRGRVPGVILFALCAAGDAWIGRITFALGVTLGLAACLALARRRPAAAAGLGALCAAASPVTGLFLALAGAAVALAGRRRRDGFVLGGPPLAVAILLALLFGEGGHEPFPATTFAATLAAALTIAALMPATEKVLRAGALLNVAAVVSSLLVPSPMGSNVGRLGVLFGAPLIGGLAVRDRRRATLMALATAGLLLWAVWGPVREVSKVSGDPSVRAAYYAPLEAFLLRDLPPGARVEVPFTRAHWETDLLARRFALARGWERQLDTRFTGAPIRGRDYLAWLRGLAVAYVAVPDVALDGSSRGEARLIASRPWFLRPVWSSRHWRVYAVASPAPPAVGAGHIVRLDHDGFALAATAPGAIGVRVRWSRYFQVVAGAARVRRASGGWTGVLARRAGAIVVRARFSLGSALQ